MKQSLNGIWQLYKLDGSDKMDVSVPGTLLASLINANKIENPHYRLNAKKTCAICDEDYVYDYSFTPSDDILSSKIILLNFEGIDTLADIFLNSEFIGSTENMHRTYEFDVTKIITSGVNNIKVTLKSPTKYIEQKNAERPLWGVDTTMTGYTHIRKAHYMYGWDWGPALPDMGIWRDVNLIGINSGRLNNVYVNQEHRTNGVNLTIDTFVDYISSDNLHVDAMLVSPNGKRYDMKAVLRDKKQKLECHIDNPLLWNVRGYGEQNLYMLTIVLFDGINVLDRKELNIGLRDVKLSRKVDDFGEEFCFVVNGTRIFAMGADYIPEDNIIPFTSAARTNKLLSDCVAANFNMIRVWGGGYYPPDYFYEICDKLGLLVWQDFMFACSVYDAPDMNFCNNITYEIIDNINRIRNHACLALWCGNNEIEVAWTNWGIPQDEELKKGYIKMFDVLIPNILKRQDAKTPYWPSSPSTGTTFDDDAASTHRGDCHYWEVWHNLKPFTEYKKHTFRFCSEYGFESLPSLKTLKTIAEKSDLNLMSPVMEEHHKCVAGSEKIMYYLAQLVHYPTSFKKLIYATQYVQALAIRLAVEQMRQNRELCNGSLYWQVNDSNPTISWSSIDYYGRWKALHYAARKFYAPVLCSIDDTDKENLKIIVSNETLYDFDGNVKWKIRKNTTEIISEGEAAISVAPCKSKTAIILTPKETQITAENYTDCYLEYTLIKKNAIISNSTYTFCLPKQFSYLEPKIKVMVDQLGEMFRFTVTSENYASGVFLDFDNNDCFFSDNWFDLTGSEKYILVNKDAFEPYITIKELEEQVKIMSYYDIAIEE